MKRAVIVHVIARDRSCYAYKAWCVRWNWLAWLLEKWEFIFRGYYGTEVYGMTDDRANEYLSNYRNWLGENRLAR